MKKKIPDGWRNYSSIGDVVPGTRFIPFKTPLKEELCRTHFRTADDWFTPAMLRQKIPKLKLVIDLTFTDRYYNSKEFSDHGIQHVKIKCPGGGQRLPPPFVINRFNQAIADFLESNSNLNDDTLIGVHCTHGLNRTGFFICRYMVEYCGLSPEQSVMAFESARGHKIEREVYIKEIGKHFNEIHGIPKRKLSERGRRNTASKEANLNHIANRRLPNRSKRNKESHRHNYSIQFNSNAQPHQYNYPRNLQNYSQNQSVKQRNSNTADDLNLRRRLNSNLQLAQSNSNDLSFSDLNWRNRKDQGVHSCSDLNYSPRLNFKEHPVHNVSNSKNWRNQSRHLNWKRNLSGQSVNSREDDANLNRPINLIEQQGHCNPSTSNSSSNLGTGRNQPRHLDWKSWSGQSVNSREDDANLSRPINLIEQQGHCNPSTSNSSSNLGNGRNQPRYLNWTSWSGQSEVDANRSRPINVTKPHYPSTSISSKSGNWRNQPQYWNGQTVNSCEDVNISRRTNLIEQPGHYNPNPYNAPTLVNWRINQDTYVNSKSRRSQT